MSKVRPPRSLLCRACRAPLGITYTAADLWDAGGIIVRAVAGTCQACGMVFQFAPRRPASVPVRQRSAR